MTERPADYEIEYAVEESYKEMLDGGYGIVTVAGYEYSTSYALKELDPIAFREGMINYEDGLESLYVDGVEMTKDDTGTWQPVEEDDDTL